MKRNSNSIRRVLLGSATLTVFAAGVQAEELSDLKAQIEALQSRVHELEYQSTTQRANAGGISIRRGDALTDWNTDVASEGALPADRGFTIAISPTADVPVPVTEVTVSGYVKADFIWDFDQDLGLSFNSQAIDSRLQKDVVFQTHANQTRFRIRSRTDTAIGEFRTLIEGDFFGNKPTYGEFRLRHAWGEWDFMPHWTLGIGRFWRLGYDVLSGITVLDFDLDSYVGPPAKSRTEQIRLEYASGPITLAFGVQGPQTSAAIDNTVAACASDLGLQTIRETGCQIIVGTGNTAMAIPIGANPAAFSRNLTNTPNLPSVGGHLMYETPEGHGFFLGAEIQQNNIDRRGEGLESVETDNAVFGGRSRLGWVLSAGADFNITEKLLFTAHLAYSEGLVSRIGGSGPDIWGQRTVFVEPDGTHVTRFRVVQSKGWGGFAGLSYRPTHTINFNARFGIADPADRAKTSGAVQWNHIYESHFNVLWRPVSQMRLGWEIMYGRKTNGKNFIKGYDFGTGNENDPHNISGGGQCGSKRANAFCRKRKEDAVRAQFAAWFFY